MSSTKDTESKEPSFELPVEYRFRPKAGSRFPEDQYLIQSLGHIVAIASTENSARFLVKAINSYGRAKELETRLRALLVYPLPDRQRLREQMLAVLNNYGVKENKQ